jgi:hypothetical protein
LDQPIEKTAEPVEKALVASAMGIWTIVAARGRQHERRLAVAAWHAVAEGGESREHIWRTKKKMKEAKPQCRWSPEFGKKKNARLLLWPKLGAMCWMHCMRRTRRRSRWSVLVVAARGAWQPIQRCQAQDAHGRVDIRLVVAAMALDDKAML